MNILITGADGQLGSELGRVLQTGCSDLGAVPPAFRDAAVLRTDRSTLDITEPGAVEEAVRAADIVVNCAAMTDVDACEDDPTTAYLVNAVGPLNLAAACERSGAKLVHVSTDHVFAGDATTPRIESDVCHPENVYGSSKLAGEGLVRAACSRAFIVRTAWLYGYVGENFVKTILSVARRDGRIEVVDDQAGNPTNADDLAHHLLKLAATEGYGTYHCVGHGVCSRFDFASRIVDLAGIPCETVPRATGDIPRPARRPACSALDNKRLRETVGDQMRPWGDALAAYLRVYLAMEGELA